MASLRRHGATLAVGTDWFVSTPDPLLGMEVAVTRISPDMRETGEVFPAHERIERWMR